jgi:hypothetical protein
LLQSRFGASGKFFPAESGRRRQLTDRSVIYANNLIAVSDAPSMSIRKRVSISSRLKGFAASRLPGIAHLQLRLNDAGRVFAILHGVRSRRMLAIAAADGRETA